MSDDILLDTSGYLCPLPVLKAAKRLKALPSGAVMRVIATDPAAVIDVPHFCTGQGHTLLSQDRQGESYIFRIRRK
ncbi:sulfurtransferase TusA family protein [soil metagenome]